MGLAALVLLLQVVDAEAAKVRIEVETPGGVAQKVFLARPVGLAADRPVVFVMHGESRKASECRDDWYELAEEHGFLLVVPEFSAADFPGAAAYDFGNVYDGQGGLRPRSTWAFEAIEPIFDDLRRRFGMTAQGYSLYGHSAGAGFVQRFLMHVPGARVNRAVVVNADGYTLPDFSVDFPHGLRNSAVNREELGRALQLPLTILISEADSDPPHSELSRGPGQLLFESARAAATALQVPFGWQLASVPGADLDSRNVAPFAIPYLLP